MGKCSAVNCQSDSEKGVHLFRFPSDPVRRKQWEMNCRRDDWKPTNGSRLCEDHFDASQFENNEMDNSRKKLKKSAIPTIFSGLNPPSKAETSDIIDRRRQKRQSLDIETSETSNFDHVMPSCSAVNGESKRGTRLLRFPIDRRKKWAINCRRDNWKPTNGSSLCENRFEESQFELKRADKWKKLKATAIPTLFNVPNPPPKIDATDLFDRRGRRKRPADLEESKTRLTPAVRRFDHEYVKRQRFVTSRKSVLHNQNGRKDQRSKKSINSSNDIKKGINRDTGCEDDGNINVRISNDNNDGNPYRQHDKKMTTIGKHFTSIAETLVKYKKRGFLCDAILVAKCGKELKAHSALLAACSPVFMTALEADPNCNGPHHLYFPDLEFDVMEIAVNFVYTGKLVLPSVYSDVGQLSKLLDELKDLGLSELHGCDITFYKKLKKSDKSDALVDTDGLSVGPSSRVHGSHETGSNGSSRKKKRRLANKDHATSVVSESYDVTVIDLPNDANDLSASGLGNGNPRAMGSSVKHSKSGRSNSGLTSILKPFAKKSVDPNFIDTTCDSANDLPSDLFKPILDENMESLFISDWQSIHPGGLQQLLDTTGFTADCRNQQVEQEASVSRPQQTFFCEFCPEQDRTEFHTAFKLLCHKMKCSWNVGHKCVYCARKFSSKYALKVHIGRHMGIQPPKTNKTYKCKDCGLHLETRGKLAGHIRKHAELLRPYECDLCGKRFEIKSSFNRHKRMHAGSRSFLCDFCGKAYATNWTLQGHVSKQHEREMRKRECAVCGVRFHSEDEMEKHAAEEHNQASNLEEAANSETKSLPTYLCDLCGKDFASARCLSKHVASHNTKQAECDVCLKKFKTKYTMLVHKRIHTGERPFVCNVCPKSFMTKVALVTHLAAHSETKPFVCVVCSKGFTSKGQLQLHLLVHTGEKPYTCDVCYKRFTYKSSLALHNRVHTGDRPFRCTICDNSYTRTGHLKSHVRTHTGERPFACQICDKSYKEKVDLRYHYTRFHKLDAKRVQLNNRSVYSFDFD